MACALASVALGLGLAANEPQLPRYLALCAAGLALASLAWFKPRWSALLLLFLLYSRLSDPLGPVGGSLTINQAVVALCLIVMLARQVTGRGPIMVGDSLFPWLLVYGVAIGLSALGAEYPSIVLTALAGYLREVAILFLILQLLAGWPSLRATSWALILAGGVLAAAAAIYGSTGYDFGGLTGGKVTPVVGSVHENRLSAHLGDPNDFAHLLVPLVPLVLYRLWDEARWLARAAAFGTLSLLCGVVVWTYSRGGFISLLVVLTLAVVMRRFKPAYLTLMSLALIPVILTTPMFYWGRLGSTAQFLSARGLGLAPGARDGGADSSERPAFVVVPSTQDGQTVDADASVTEGARTPEIGDLSLSDRSRLWRVGAAMFLEHPLVGVGRDNYRPHYGDYAWRVDPTLPVEPLTAHFTPLHVMAETGLIGLASLAAVIVIALRKARTARRYLLAAGRGTEASCLEALEIGIYGYLVASLFLNDNMRPLWLLLGLTMIGSRACARTADPPGQLASRSAAAPAPA